MAEERKKVSTEQLRILVEEIEKDSTLLIGRPGGRAPIKREYSEKWDILAKRLNCVENGAVKNVSKWQQSLRDWKSNTKKKAAKIMKDKSCQSDVNQELTSLEQRLLNLYDEDHSPVKASGIDISYIAEIDPLSSDDSMEEHVWNEMESICVPNELNITKSSIATECEREKEKLGNGEDQRDILARLSAIEASQQEMEKCHHEHVKAMIAALKSHTVVALRQSKAMEAQTQAILKLLERRG